MGIRAPRPSFIDIFRSRSAQIPVKFQCSEPLKSNNQTNFNRLKQPYSNATFVNQMRDFTSSCCLLFDMSLCFTSVCMSVCMEWWAGWLGCQDLTTAGLGPNRPRYGAHSAKHTIVQTILGTDLKYFSVLQILWQQSIYAAHFFGFYSHFLQS